jgi:hypothetical protein
MADLAELEARIRVLESIEEIKKLKAKYFRCLDKKLWSELEDVFAENAIGEGPYGGPFKGNKAIVQFISKNLGSDSVITAHGGHNPEIEITSDTTAKAIWALEDYVSFGRNRKFIGYGHYEDEYIKEKGEWKIKRQRLTRIIEEWTIIKHPGTSAAKDKAGSAQGDR